MAAIDEAAAGPAVDATALRGAIGKLLPAKDLNVTSIKALREELEEVLGLGPGGLDSQRVLVRELLQEEIQLQLERPAAVLSLDTPLLELASVADMGDTSSDSDSEGKEKRKIRKAAKRARLMRSAPTPLRRRDAKEGGVSSKKRRGAAEGKADRGTAEGKAARLKGQGPLGRAGGALQEQVEKAVQHYITENADTWTASEMREDISVLHGWENDARFATLVKSAVIDLGYTNSGGNVLKGNR